jgi:kumamolisin
MVGGGDLLRMRRYRTVWLLPTQQLLRGARIAGERRWEIIKRTAAEKRTGVLGIIQGNILSLGRFVPQRRNGGSGGASYLQETSIRNWEALFFIKGHIGDTGQKEERQMKSRLLILLCGFVALLGSGAIPVNAQDHQKGIVVWPDSSVEREENIGLRAHTNHLMLLDPKAGGGTPSGLTPGIIRGAYDLTYAQSQGSGTIVIVDAYDYPTAVADFNAFSQAFGLPQETGSGNVLQVVYAKGAKPGYNSGWSQEAALDIEWAHALAPTAKIVLVEAASNSLSDLLYAVDVAGTTIAGAREVSMSWGSGEFSSETLYDSHFTASGVVYFAASGDSGGKPIWPSVSPNVVSAGGTTLNVDSSGHFLSETGWSGSGGGKSKFEPRPTYQDVIMNIVGNKRGTPDLSFDADPNTGVSVYWQGGWYVFGGTSVSTPSLTAIVNLAASSGTGFAASTAEELGGRVYLNLANPDPSSSVDYDFRDIISGRAGRLSCSPGWDFVTGKGSDWGLLGK